jgi:gliding motility-associated transport system ATP-binding protein
MINVENLSRAYGDFRAVDGVSFHIPAGQIVGLLGHNGAGKTTVMKMLSGYLEPSGGSISIAGLNLADQTRDVQQQLGYLPENLPIYADMGVADYLHFAATLKGLQGEELKSSVRRVVRDTELEGKLIDPIATLSRGYRQRVGVAQAILGSPTVLILDEPTNGLDPNQTQHMRDLIKAMSATATVILSTHIMQEVDAICDRVLILRDGKLALDDTLASLRSAGALQVKTSLSAARLQELIPTLQVNSAGDHFRVGLPAGGDPDDAAALDKAAAMVAAAISSEGGQLFRLAPEVRDLETVFREVSLQAEISHAA